MTEPKVWIYNLRAENNCWLGRVVLTSDGYFSTFSDYGSYAYWWRDFEPEDFRQFLISCWDDYILGKISSRDTYNGERTCKRIQQHILEYRRDRIYSKEFARQEWDYLKDCQNVSNMMDFHRWYDGDGLGDAAEFAYYDYDPQARGFVEHVLPVLKRKIKEQLANESS